VTDQSSALDVPSLRAVVSSKCRWHWLATLEWLHPPSVDGIERIKVVSLKSFVISQSGTQLIVVTTAVFRHRYSNCAGTPSHTDTSRTTLGGRAQFFNDENPFSPAVLNRKWEISKVTKLRLFISR